VKKYTLELIAGYKIITNLFRLILGIIILVFKCNISNMILFFSRKELAEDSKDFFFNFLSAHVHDAHVFLVFLLALVLIIFSSLEIAFSIELFMKRKRGAVGLFVVSPLWIPFEIMFISRFLLVHRITTIILDLIVLGVLLNIIMHFNKNRSQEIKVN